MGKKAGPPTLCWSCQKNLPTGPGTNGGRVRLAEDFYLPVCRDCWTLMPEADRLRVAMMFRDRGVEFSNVADVLAWMREVMAHSEMFQQVPDWLRRDDNPN